MAQYIKQGSLAGRLGSGVGQGLAEQLPKEIERGRLASGLQQLGQQKNLTPFQQFSSLASLPGITPQMIQSGGDLLRQQAIINSLNPNKEMPPLPATMKPYQENGLVPQSATTAESTGAALNPYIPPSGPEREDMARRMMAAEPQVYPSIESARGAVDSQIAANEHQSNARLAKRELEESVQARSEQKLRDEIATVGAQVPGRVLSDLQQQAVDDVASKKLSPDQAKVKYGKEADKISQSFSDIRSWGNLGLITNNAKELMISMSALQKSAKEGGYQKEAAQALVADNGVTPQLAHSILYPVSDIKPLNEELKSLTNIQPRLEKVPGAPGLAGVGRARPMNANADKLTLEVAPRLARAMGPEGSPLSIGYELQKKGYDPNIWKQYLLDNQEELNLTSNQISELAKTKPSFFGALNDWFLKSFSGIK